MLSCNLYNNYFFNWSSFWSTVQKLAIVLTHKHFGGAGRPNSALHLKPFCRDCVWSTLALGMAGSLTLGVWKSVREKMYALQCLFFKYYLEMIWRMTDLFFFFIPSWLSVSLELETCLCWKKSLNAYEEQKMTEGYSVCRVVSPEPQWFQAICDLPSFLSKSKADCL